MLFVLNMLFFKQTLIILRSLFEIVYKTKHELSRFDIRKYNTRTLELRAWFMEQFVRLLQEMISCRFQVTMFVALGMLSTAKAGSAALQVAAWGDCTSSEVVAAVRQFPWHDRNAPWLVDIRQILLSRDILICPNGIYRVCDR